MAIEFLARRDFGLCDGTMPLTKHVFHGVPALEELSELYVVGIVWEEFAHHYFQNKATSREFLAQDPQSSWYTLLPGEDEWAWLNREIQGLQQSKVLRSADPCPNIRATVDGILEILSFDQASILCSPGQWVAFSGTEGLSGKVLRDKAFLSKTITVKPCVGGSKPGLMWKGSTFHSPGTDPWDFKFVVSVFAKSPDFQEQLMLIHAFTAFLNCGCHDPAQFICSQLPGIVRSQKDWSLFKSVCDRFEEFRSCLETVHRKVKEAKDFSRVRGAHD